MKLVKMWQLFAKPHEEITAAKNHTAALLMRYARHLRKLRLKNVPHIQNNYSIWLMFSVKSEKTSCPIWLYGEGGKT